MDVYVAHPSSIDFVGEVYRPIRSSSLDESHTFILPHEDTSDQFESKPYLREDCDLVVAVASDSSTGMGIELGWADVFDVPIVCVHKAGTSPSGALAVVADTIEEYETTSGFVDLLNGILESQ